MSPGPAITTTRWAHAIARALIDAGVRHLIVSPGSRSTPLVLATGDLDRQVIVDERSAAFAALGLARAADAPVALLCTSGSAGGHYLPAIMEASHSGIPLIAMTADRPTRLLGRGANQTTDQRQLYATFVRDSADLGDPTAGREDRAYRRVVELVQRATGPDPGPVHVNARFDKPLEPAGEAPFFEPSSPALAADGCPQPFDTSLLGAVADRIRASERTLVVCGPCAPTDREAVAAAVGALTARTGGLLWAESVSGVRFGNAAASSGDALGWLAHAVDPDLVVQIGQAPIAALPAAPSVVLCRRGTPDPDRRAEHIIRGPLAPMVRALAGSLPERPPSSWAETWRARNRATWAVVADHVRPDVLSEPAAIRAAVTHCPDHAILQLGNSQPVREVDRYCRAGDCRAEVHHQRGLSGIDGSIAQAIGASVTGRPVAAIIGDVTFRHDIASLALASCARAPVAVVVVDNGGGRIFESLPVADHPAAARDLEAFFVTPPAIDLAAVAAAFGAAVATPTTPGELGREVRRACARSPGVTVILARVDPPSARRMREGIDAALAELG